MTEKAQIGVTGLAVMGRNLARNFARHGHTVALHNRTLRPHQGAGRGVRRTRARSSPSESAEEFVASLERPRRVVIMVKAGEPTDAVIDEFAPLLEPGDMLIDAGNAHFLDTRRREAALQGARPALRRHRRLRRRGGRAARAEHHAGRLAGVVRGARPAAGGHLGEGRRRAVLRARRPGRRRPLRQDGAQRHRVRRHAAHRRGVRPAAAGRRALAGRDRGDLPGLERGPAGLVPDRDHRRGAQAGRRRRPASRSSTWCWTRPSRRAPAAGPCRPPSTWACRSAASPSRCSPARSPATPTLREAAAAGLPGPTATRRRRRRRPAGRRRAGAVRLEDRGVRAGLPADPGGQQGVRLGHRPGRDGQDLAGRLHHPGQVPGLHQAGVRQVARAADAAGGRLLPGRRQRRAGRLAAGRGHGRAAGHPGARASPRRWPTTTACAPSACRPR